MADGTTEERLEDLERATRRYRLVIAGLGMAILASAVIWVVLGATGRAQAQNPGEAGKVIRATKFILEDEHGRTRAELSVKKDGPALWLCDENGMDCVLLNQGKEGPGLWLYGKEAKVRASIDVGNDESALTLLDEKGKIRVMLSLSKDGPLLGFDDEKGASRALLSATGDSPTLSLRDANSRPIWHAP